jgi:archaellum component FlaF (FlaF/FlaG flagellin family)
MQKKFLLLLVFFFIALTINSYSYVSVDINQSRCWEREGTATAGYPDGTNLCDTPSNLNADDSLYESTGSGPNNFAEIRTSHNHIFPDNCYLVSVEACVDFYSVNIVTCTGVQVSNDEGSSWSSSFGACPTSDLGTVCYDVTSLRNWASNCSDFSGNKSEIFIELSYRGNNIMYTDYVAYKVNYTTNPNLTNPYIIPQTAYNNNTLNCSVNITDAEETSLTVNFTWFQNNNLNSSFDAEVLCQRDTVCYTSSLVTGLEIGHNWTCSAIVFDGYLYSEWKNSTPITISNREPIVKNISINENTSINLLAAQNKSVSCTGSLVEYDGYQDISSVSAAFYNTDLGFTSSSSDNRSAHYTNSSCFFSAQPGSEQEFNCSFSLDYYAVNGTWECEVSVSDNQGSTNILRENIEVNPLTAIGVSLGVLDFDKIQVMGTSGDVSLGIINYGNIDLDLEVFAYASEEDDETAFICELGEIPLSNLRYSLFSGIEFDLMNQITGKSSPSFINFNLLRRAWEDPESQKNLYWKLRIPSFREGFCEGKLVFSAIPN